MSVSTTKAHAQNPPGCGLGGRSITEEFENRIPRAHILLLGFQVPNIKGIAGERVSSCRAERVRRIGGVAERQGGPTSESIKKITKAHPANVAKRNDEDAKRSARRAKAPRREFEDNADTIQTSHLHYHGNGVWSSNPSRLSAV